MPDGYLYNFKGVTLLYHIGALHKAKNEIQSYCGVGREKEMILVSGFNLILKLCQIEYDLALSVLASI